MIQITRQPDQPSVSDSRAVVYEQLEDFARHGVQEMLQRILEEEVDALLGREKSERRSSEAPAGYRNGFGKERCCRR